MFKAHRPVSDPVTVSQLLAPRAGELIRDLVPEWLLPAVLAITELGNVVVLLVVFVLDYWYGDHRRGAHAIGVAFGGMALITALKYAIAAPRPPATVNVVPIGGYSFPSGHAVTATIGYGILAYDVRVGPKWARYTAAAVVIAAVALSRVVLGVHFVRDIVAGVVVGLAFLVAAIALTRHEPRLSFLLAVGVSVVAVVVGGAAPISVLFLGASVGAALAWELMDGVPRVESTRGRLALLLGGVPVLGGLGYAVAELGLPLPLVFLGSGLMAAVILVAPHVGDALEESDAAPPEGSEPSRG